MTVTGTLVIRLDATARIGSGHATRCEAIAQAAETLGARAIFAVSCAESADFVKSLGCETHVLGGNPMALGEADGRTLAAWCADVGAAALLVDTYAVTHEFFKGLAAAKPMGLRIAYLDDLYTFTEGNLAAPIARPVSAVLNYNLYADRDAYRTTYAGTNTELLLGPAYAPLRREFWNESPHGLRPEIRDVLVTTGSTNPGNILERLTLLARKSFPGAAVHVVVGAKSSFDGPLDGLNVLGPQPSLLPLMQRCDVCISAAGTTLYELCALGVPTVAIAIADNQAQNVFAFKRLKLGLGYISSDDNQTIAAGMCMLAHDHKLREKYFRRMTNTVQGKGAERIAQALLLS